MKFIGLDDCILLSKYDGGGPINCECLIINADDILLIKKAEDEKFTSIRLKSDDVVLTEEEPDKLFEKLTFGKL